ncbi:hypothetical protein MSAN_01580600 [Mycena sanguinolenta]|uniref:Uncharacterized protein n=1 Tax=Mycena sanguinolenta TaxID=230812 RepID=A0A8H6Y004_9AGAR|nr:hypothetical protein MSAN_01580600 [Mycena sanguinolenta]
MPRQPTVSEIRLDDTITCLRPAISMLNDLHDAFATPFVPVISTITLSLIPAVQTTGGIPPAMLHHVGKFTEALQKIHTFVDAQKGANRIKSFFRQGEMGVLLKDCQESLRQAMEVFKIESGSTILKDIGAMKETANNMHREMLQLISNLPDEASSMAASSTDPGVNKSSYQARYNANPMS